jgi:hypothetical protein
VEEVNSKHQMLYTYHRMRIERAWAMSDRPSTRGARRWRGSRKERKIRRAEDTKNRNPFPAFRASLAENIFPHFQKLTQCTKKTKQTQKTRQTQQFKQLNELSI